MFNARALYAWIALMAFSAGWIAQGWHRDNITLKQWMLITAIEDQVSMDACLDLQSSACFFANKQVEIIDTFSQRHYQQIVKKQIDNKCAEIDFISVFNNTLCEVGTLNE